MSYSPSDQPPLSSSPSDQPSLSSSPSDQPSLSSSPPPTDVSLQSPGKKLLVWLIGFVIVLVLIGGGAFYYFQSLSTPGKTLTAFCDGWKNGDAQQTYDQFDVAQQKTLDLAAMKKQFQNSANRPSNCNVSNIQKKGSTATGTLGMSIKGGPSGAVVPLTFNTHLVQEHGTWKIDKLDAPTPTTN